MTESNDNNIFTDNNVNNDNNDSVNSTPENTFNVIPETSETHVPELGVTNSFNAVPETSEILEFDETPNSFNSTPVACETIEFNSMPKLNINSNTQNNLSNESVANPFDIQEQAPKLMGEYTITNNQTQMNDDINLNNNVNTEEDLLREFIGNNYEKITTKKLNFSGLIFTSLYMLYRKMFIYAILVFIIELVILNFISQKIIGLILLLSIHVIIGFTINKIYVRYAKGKVSKIKKENASSDIEVIKGICAIKGGTSIGKVFLGVLVEFVIAFILLIIMSLVGLKSVFSSIIPNFKNNIKKVDEYKGYFIVDTSVSIQDNFSIVVPNIFNDNSTVNKYNYLYETGMGDLDDCSISFYAIENSKDVEKMINNMAKYRDKANYEKNGIKKDTINGIDWYIYSEENEFGKTRFYGTSKDEKTYILELGLGKDTGNICEYYLLQVLNSIESK